MKRESGELRSAGIQPLLICVEARDISPWFGEEGGRSKRLPLRNSAQPQIVPSSSKKWKSGDN